LFSIICIEQPNLLGFFGDDGVYLGGAQSLLEGRGYRIPFLPLEPFQTKYPPLYGLFLAGFMGLGLVSKAGDFLLWLPSVLCLTATAFCFDALLKTRWPEMRALSRRVLIAAVIFHPAFFDYLRFAMSEMLFLLLLSSSFVLLDKTDDRRLENVSRVLVLAGLLAGSAVLTRSIGLSWVAAGSLWCFLVLRPRKQFLYFLIPGLVPYLFWIAYANTLATRNAELLPGLQLYGYYLGYLISVYDLVESAVVVVSLNLISFADSIAHLLSFYSIPIQRFPHKPIFVALIAASGIGMLVGGLYRSYRVRGLRPELIFIAVYVAMVLVWPYEPQRFLVVLIPWFLLLIGESFRALSRRWSPLGRAVIPLSILLAILGLWGNSKFYRQDVSRFGLFNRGLDLSQSTKALSWMRENLPEEAIVASVDPGLVYHQSGRKAVPALNEGNLIRVYYPDHLVWNSVGNKGAGRIAESQKEFIIGQRRSVWRDWKSLGVTHVWDDDALSRFPGTYALKAQTSAHAHKLELVYSSSGSRVYRLLWNPGRSRKISD